MWYNESSGKLKNKLDYYTISIHYTLGRWKSWEDKLCQMLDKIQEKGIKKIYKECINCQQKRGNEKKASCSLCNYRFLIFPEEE